MIKPNLNTNRIPCTKIKIAKFLQFCSDNQYPFKSVVEANLLHGLDELCRKYVNKGSRILELGSRDGVSASLFAYYSDKVTTVDINCSDALNRVLKIYPNINFEQMRFDPFLHQNTESYDLVYIDGDHSYENVIQDIKLSRDKIDRGGYISGHDYSILCPGVIKAVGEIFTSTDVEIFSDSSWLVKAH